MALRNATDDDWRAITGTEPPAHWIGFTYVEDGKALALGGLYECRANRWWATVTPGVKRPVSLYKAAREVLDTAKAVDLPVHALANPAIPGADRFLHRLGFRPTDEMLGEHRVLKWTP